MKTVPLLLLVMQVTGRATFGLEGVFQNTDIRVSSAWSPWKAMVLMPRPLLLTDPHQR